MTKDEKYISRCLQLAYNGLCNTAPNPMVGAVIVYHDTIIGEGYHIRCGEAHAEAVSYTHLDVYKRQILYRAKSYQRASKWKQ